MKFWEAVDPEIIIAVLHRFRTDGVLACVRLCNCCSEFGLCRWAMHSKACHCTTKKWDYG